MAAPGAGGASVRSGGGGASGISAAGPAARAVRWLREDVSRLLAGLRTARELVRLRALPMSLVFGALVLVFSIVQHTAVGEDAVEMLGVVHASLPLSLELLRTPFSLFVPALDLPAWGAILQVVIVFGLAELVLGRGRTAMIALLSTLAGTMYARIGVWLGPGAPLGLEPADAFVRDTGPSAAVVALAVYLAWHWRSRLMVGLIAGAMALEAVLVPNLAGREHLFAILAGVLLALADGAMGRMALRRVPLPGRGAARGRVHRAPAHGRF